MRVPWYIHGNWKLDSAQLTDLENTIPKIVSSDKDDLYTTYHLSYADKSPKELSFLNNFYAERVAEIAKDQTFYYNSSYRYEFWVQLYNSNATHSTHTHFELNKNTIISFVHFLKTTDTECLQFINEDEIDVPQQSEGDLIVFPSYAAHRVVNHTNDYNRLVVAGNIQILEHYAN